MQKCNCASCLQPNVLISPASPAGRESGLDDECWRAAAYAKHLLLCNRGDVEPSPLPLYLSFPWLGYRWGAGGLSSVSRGLGYGPLLQLLDIDLPWPQSLCTLADLQSRHQLFTHWLGAFVHPYSLSCSHRWGSSAAYLPLCRSGLDTLLCCHLPSAIANLSSF